MPIIQHLIVDQYGAFIGKHSGRLRVTKDKQKLAEAPLLHLEQVLVTGRGVSLSADAIRACCTAGIPIYFVDSRGRPYAALYAAGLTGTVLTRREQLLAYTDRRGLEVAVAFARGKISNQAGFLRYTAKYRQETDADLYQELRWCADEVRDHLEELRRLQGNTVDDVRGQILSTEGRAAQKYWNALKQIIPEQYNWPGRRGRGARDPVNAGLNYGYGILYGQIERALVLAGLDPYGGFIHTDRPGKPSLVFDLIEQFRQVIVDRTIVGIWNWTKRGGWWRAAGGQSRTRCWHGWRRRSATSASGSRCGSSSRIRRATSPPLCGVTGRPTSHSSPGGDRRLVG